MTAKEILAKVEEAGFSEENFAWGDFDSEELGIGKWTEVYQYGGEGEGDHWESVKHFTDHDVYIRTVGSYQSYNGTEFYDGYGEEVKPQQETRTIYK